jgi:putative Mg2+ transporter-C (MgtC) family protein
MVLIVLTLFENIQRVVVRLHQARSYKITFQEDGVFVSSLEAQIKKLNLRFHKARDLKNESNSTVTYELFGPEKRLEEFNAFLKSATQVKAYEY